jgi:signal transduction histidine kinase/CheY-like chemotaxis protein
VTPPTLRDLARRLRRTRLGVRLAVLSAVLAAAVVFGTFAALSVRVRASTRQLFADELSRNQRTLVALQTENRRRLVLTAALLAESPNLRSAMATFRVEHDAGRIVRPDLTNTVQRELERRGRDLNAGVLLATDERGLVFAGYSSGGGKLPRGLGLATLPAVRNALDPAVTSSRSETYLSGLELGDAYYAVGAAPVILNGYTIGALVFGQRVDSSLVATLRAAFDGDVVASAGGRVIAATLPAGDAHAVVESANAREGSVKLGAQEYLAALIPMGQTQRHTELRLTLLQPLTPTVNALAGKLRRDFTLYGVLAVVLAGLGAAMLSRSLLRPLRAFIAAMRGGADGDGVPAAPAIDAENASQEIRVLNTAFTRLMDALRKERSALERRGAQLAAANEVLTDEIREREKVEKALRASEAQLRQSQKLEAIGTLAGGIAHDFNNLLTVISGFTQLALGRLGRTHEVAGDLKEVMDASERAASLTHQLLAFSRKQVLQPRVLDLDATVSGMQGMLRRLIGSHIELRVEHDGQPARIKADPSQLEQVVLNLVVNARDAMPEGGTVTIATRHDTDAPGVRRVTLCVTDDGVGMTRDVRDRIFEPFFTTKEAGKGTGLGLSTVYGVIAQSGGTVEVDSIVGKGSMFTVSFPSAGDLTTSAQDTDDETAPVGSETILLVDDDDAIRKLAEQSLVACGYTVVAARNGIEALTLARTMKRIDVLLTDIVMPQLSGPQLAERILAKQAAPCVIFMTGWVDDATMELELDADVTLLRKPFTPIALARAVRNALDATDASLPLPAAD